MARTKPLDRMLKRELLAHIRRQDREIATLRNAVQRAVRPAAPTPVQGSLSLAARGTTAAAEAARTVRELLAPPNAV